MFENLRQSLNELMDRATRPEDRRLIMVRMKSTLVQAKLGVDDLRDALAQTTRKLEAERRELETVRRRKDLATTRKDQETVTIAERFEKQHAERVALLEQKVAVQTREVELAERELDGMKAELRAAMTGGGIATPTSTESIEEALGEDLGSTGEAGGPRVREEIDALARERARADRDADADRRLEELKRKMGR